MKRICLSTLLFLRRFLAGLAAGLVLLMVILQACNSPEQDQAHSVSLTALQQKALDHFSPLPEHAFGEGELPLQARIDLGRKLYYEPRLSRSGLLSCNSCHSLSTFGVDNLPVSTGHMWRQGPLNAPTVLNAALHRLQFWDGRARDVEEQAGMPILDALEMAATEEHVLQVLQSIPEYVTWFGEAFPEEPQPLVYANVGRAIGAFERILLTPSAFDQYLAGDAGALGENALAGLETFMDVGCTACHNGAALGGQIFTFFQTPAERARGEFHPGRFGATGREADKHFFKVPSLRNIVKTYPYLHDGSEWSLEATLNIVAEDMLGKELSPEENQRIMYFLATLTGELPEYAREIPVLPASTPSTPRPNIN